MKNIIENSFEKYVMKCFKKQKKIYFMFLFKEIILKELEEISVKTNKPKDSLRILIKIIKNLLKNRKFVIKK